MSVRTVLQVLLIGIVAAGTGAYAQEGFIERTIIDKGVERTERWFSPNWEMPSGDRGSIDGDGILWEYTNPRGIPRSIAFSSASGSVWVGQDLSDTRLQRFEMTGDGTPVVEFAAPEYSAYSAAAAEADLAVIVHSELVRGGVRTQIDAYSSQSTEPEWTYEFDGRFKIVPRNVIAVSRDGGIVAATVQDRSIFENVLHVIDGASGQLLRTYSYSGFTNTLDINDDGSLAIIATDGWGHVIDLETMTEIFRGPTVGASGGHRISGDGNVIVIAGLELRCFVRTGGTYEERFSFTSPDTRFGSGVAVSRDGTTVASYSYQLDPGFRTGKTSFRVWDVQTGMELGHRDVLAQVDSRLQNAGTRAAASDDGSIFAVCSWGAADANPEVIVFDRSARQIGEIDTIGSPMSIDITGDGRFVAVGSKLNHANIGGSGGSVTLYEVPANCDPCDMNCDGEINAFDIEPFLQLLFEPNPEPCDICTGDVNGDGNVDAFDIEAFLECLFP